MKAILSFLSVIILNSTLLFSQEKKVLTLEDAVLKQYADLGPDRVRGLNWLNESTYIRNKGKGMEEILEAFDMKKGKSSTVISVAELNQLLKPFDKEIKALPRFKRVASNKLIFSVENSYFLFDAKKKKLSSFENEKEGISDVHFSAEGSYMAFVKNFNVHAGKAGDYKAYSSDGNADLVYGQAASRFEFGISEGIFMSPKGMGLAYYRNDQGAVTEYPIVDLTKTPAESKPIKYPMAGGPSEKVTVLAVMDGGEAVEMKTNPEEDAYICSVNWTPDAKQMVLVTLNRDQNHAKYQRFDVATGNLIGVEYEEKDEKYVEPLYNLIFTTDDGSEYIYLSQKDGWMHAYHKTAAGEKQLTKGKWVITKYLGSDPKKSVFYFEGTGENPTENHIYKVDLESGEMKRISKNAGTYHAVLSPDASYMITYFSSIDKPNKTVIADADGIVKKLLLDASDPLEGYAVSKPELLTISDNQGAILHARMIKPSNFDENKKYPVLVYVYNGPHVQLIKNKWWGGAALWMNYMAEKGYIVFTVDGHGSYNRGKDFEQVIFRNMGEVEMLDQIAGVEYLKKQSFVDKDRMAVHGWSYGGYMTTSLMLKHPDVFKVGVAGGPVTNWKYYEVMYTERYMDTPQTNDDGFRNTDLTNFVTNLKGKLLLIHGMSDDVVVPQHNLTLIKKFVDEGVQVDFFPYPGHPHNVRGKDRVHLMRKVLNYVDDNLN